MSDIKTNNSGASSATGKRGLTKLKWWQWLLVGIGVLVLVSIIVNGLNGRTTSSDAETASTNGSEQATTGGGFTQESKRPAEEAIEMVAVPELVGDTIGEARAKLDKLGLTLDADGVEDDWVITAQQPVRGSYPLEGLELSVTSEAPKPVYTLAQQNAIRKAQSYLDYSGFSRAGLIGQLEYEGFSTEDATFGADNAGADWMAEAAEKAASYLDYSSFSRQGLYDQLAYEEFTPEQIEHGLAAVGY
ncbi:Ltp family lipoprotein [Microbacterium sp. MC2]